MKIEPMFFFSVQLEELLEPYLSNTYLGVPYWDWTKNLNIPHIWKDILVPLKQPDSKDYEEVLNQLQTKSLKRKSF